jgi:hypothetical protein
MTILPRLQGCILTAAVAALLLLGPSNGPFAPEPHNGAASARPADADLAPYLDRSRKGDRLHLRPAAQAVNTTIIPRAVFAPAATPGLPDIDDREHVPMRAPAPLADCVGQASPADAIGGRDISSCFV